MDPKTSQRETVTATSKNIERTNGRPKIVDPPIQVPTDACSISVRARWVPPDVPTVYGVTAEELRLVATGGTGSLKLTFGVASLSVGLPLIPCLIVAESRLFVYICISLAIGFVALGISLLLIWMQARVRSPFQAILRRGSAPPVSSDEEAGKT